MDQRELNNPIGKFDALETEGGDMAALLRALPRVEAPGNFEFGVRARIAQEVKPAASLLPFLKVAAPLSLVLLIGAFVVFYGLLPGRTDVPAVLDTARTETKSVPPTSSLPEPPVQAISAPQLDPKSDVAPDRATTAAEKLGPVRRTNNSEVAAPTRGGSFDIALGSANTKLPKGFESAERRGLNSNANLTSAGVAVRNVLGILGISANFVDGGWKVQSVAENSIALRSGVLAGDVIKALDGQQLNGDSVSSGGVKTLTIRREGKTISVNVKN